MSSLNKKAMSNIVASVFLIAVGIASVSIIFVSINSFTSQLSPIASCTELRINPPVSIESACLNSSTNEIETRLKRDIQDQNVIHQLGFTAFLTQGQAEWLCGGHCQGSEILSPGESIVYYLDLQTGEVPESVAISVNTCALESKEIISC